MNNLFLTLLIAFVLIVIAMALLAIGWLWKGRIKIEKCGRDPNKKRDESCSSSPCDLCAPSLKTPSKNELSIEDEKEED